MKEPKSSNIKNWSLTSHELTILCQLTNNGYFSLSGKITFSTYKFRKKNISESTPYKNRDDL